MSLPPPPQQTEHLLKQKPVFCVGVPADTGALLQVKLLVPNCSQLFLLNIFEMTYL